MEIRFLQEDEIANAAGVARFVFDHYLRNRVEFPQTIEFVEEYLTEANLKQQKEEGRLLLWGAFESGRLWAVGGMQIDGLITMLYVLPQYFHRGMGTGILNTMRAYAKEVLGLTSVYVNATPASTMYYFESQGFRTAGPKRNTSQAYVSMYVSLESMEIKTNKKVPLPVLLGATIGTVVLVTILTLIFMLWYVL